MADEAPKSAYELAMERLRKKDREAGVEEKPLSDEQRSRIAELRRVYDAKLAEREIQHQARTARIADHAERELAEKEYRAERERVTAEREAKLEEIRAGRG